MLKPRPRQFCQRVPTWFCLKMTAAPTSPQPSLHTLDDLDLCLRQVKAYQLDPLRPLGFQTLRSARRVNSQVVSTYIGKQ